MRGNFLKIIVLALIAVVVIQAYYLYDMNRVKSAANAQRIMAQEIRSSSFPEIPPFSDIFNDQRNPFIEMERLRRELENSFMNFDNFFQSTPSLDRFSSLWHRIPRFDMKEQKGKYLITLEIPGSNDASIDAKVEKGRLTVTAKVLEEKDDNKTNYYRHERRTSSFRRDIVLPNDAADTIESSVYKDGLLIISIEKKKS